MRFANLLVQNMVLRSGILVVAILTTLLLTRLMGVDGYGIFSLMVANASVLVLLTCLGIESGITFHYSDPRIPAPSLFFMLLSVVALQLLVVIILEWLCNVLTGHYWLLDASGMQMLYWGAGYLLSLSVIDKYTALLNAHRYLVVNGCILLANAVTLGVFAWYFFSGAQRPTTFYLQVFIVGSLLQALLLFANFHLATRTRFAITWPGMPQWRILFSFSFLIFATNAIQFFAYRVDYWIIDHFLDKDALGLYSLSVKLAQLIWVLPFLFSSMIFPQVADRTKSHDLPRIHALLRICNTLLLAGGILVMVLAPWMIPLLAGSRFSGSVMPFILLVPGIVIFSWNILLAAIISGQGRIGVTFRASVLCFLCVLALDLLLIPVYGITGAAIASTIAYTLSTVYLVWRYTAFRISSLREIGLAAPVDFQKIGDYLKTLTKPS